MKLPKLGNLLKNAALFGVTFSLCFLVAELALRWMGYGNLELYVPDEKLYWRLKPNQECFTKIDHKPVRINSQGTRGPEFVPAKPAGTLRILSLGDSRTFGWGLSESETYSAVLEKMLREKLGGARKVEVINAGVNAWSYSQLAVYFRETGLSYAPDIVLVGDANLWTQFSEKNSPEFVRQFMSRVRLKNFLRRFALYHYVVEVKLQDFYIRHRSKFIPVDPKSDTMFKDQQQDDPEAVFRRAVEDLCQTAQQHQIKPLVIFMPLQTDFATTNQSVVLRAKLAASRRLNVPLLDLTPDITPKQNSLYLEADPVHFNVEGNEIIARRVFQALNDLLTP